MYVASRADRHRVGISADQTPCGDLHPRLSADGTALPLPQLSTPDVRLIGEWSRLPRLRPRHVRGHRREEPRSATRQDRRRRPAEGARGGTHPRPAASSLCQRRASHENACADRSIHCTAARWDPVRHDFSEPDTMSQIAADWLADEGRSVTEENELEGDGGLNRLGWTERPGQLGTGIG